MKERNSNSFILMAISWLLVNLIYAFICAYQFGKVNDSGVILAWSGVYILLSWAIFIWLPPIIIKRLKFGKFISYASPIMGLYTGIIYTILFGTVGDTYIFFLPYAVLTGLIYGFLLTITNFKYITKKYLLLMGLFIGVFFYFIFPTILPSMAFRYMPDKTQSKIVSRIIPKLKVGDSYQTYLTKLPNAFTPTNRLGKNSVWSRLKEDISDDFSTSLSASNEYIHFNMKVEKGIITELNYELKN